MSQGTNPPNQGWSQEPQPNQGWTQGPPPPNQGWTQGSPQGPIIKEKKPIWKRPWFIGIAAVVAFVIIGGALGGDDEPAATNPEATATRAVDEAETTPAAETEAAQATEEAAVVEEETSAPDDGAAESETVAIGQPFTIDDWEVTINAVGEPVSEVGNEYLNTKAQGQFVPVTITAKNVGKEATWFFADRFKMLDDQDREFSYSSDATIYGAEEGAVSFMDEINPGNAVTGPIYFDVAADATITSVVVEGGLFTEPVVVPVG